MSKTAKKAKKVEKKVTKTAEAKPVATVVEKSAFTRFGELLRKPEKTTRQKLFSQLQDEGYDIKDYSVANYVALAKKDAAVFGLRLVEETDKDGNRFLKRVKGGKK